MATAFLYVSTIGAISSMDALAKHIREAAGQSAGDASAQGDNIPLALLGWVAGCTAIWSALFAEGSYLYGRLPQAIFLTVVFIVSSVVLVAVVRRTWAEGEV